MKKIRILFICALSLLIGSCVLQAEESDEAIEVQATQELPEQPCLYPLNQIEVVIFGDEESAIITTSEIQRPSLSGGYRTQDDIVLERLIHLDAKKHKIPEDDDAVDAYLMQIQREHNLTPDELENIFTSSGYTIEEGREQLRMMQTINTMLDIKIRSNLIVPRKDIESYYHAHPEFSEAVYTLERAFVPFSTNVTKKRQYTRLINYAAGTMELSIEWSEPFTLSHSEIAEDKHFIYMMEPGAIAEPHEIDGGFELFKLVEKMPPLLKSLDASYREIADILRRPKYEELMQKYRETLFNTAGIVYF